MAQPLQGDMTTLKRLGLNLHGKPRMIIDFPCQDNPYSITKSVDSDYAGCARTRKSTIGGLVALGKHVVKHWPYTQAILAPSSEAQCYSLFKGGPISIGVKAIPTGLGRSKTGPVLLKTDATAARRNAQLATGSGHAPGDADPQGPDWRQWADALDKHAEQLGLRVRAGHMIWPTYVGLDDILISRGVPLRTAAFFLL